MSANNLDLIRRSIIENTKSYSVNVAEYAKAVEDSDLKIAELDEEIAATKRHIIQLEDLRDKERAIYEESLNLRELDLMDANRVLAKETTHNQQKSHDLMVSTKKLRDVEREVAERETLLNKNKRYRDILLKMASLMQIDEDTLVQALAHNSKEGIGVNDSEMLMALVNNLSEQNLLHITATDRRKEVLDERRTNLYKIEEEGTDDIQDLPKLEHVIQKEERRLSTLKRLVAFTPSLSVDDEDIEWDALTRNVTEVCESCMGRFYLCNATEMLCKIEGHLLSLMDQLEILPRVMIKRVRKLIVADRIKKKTQEKLKDQRKRELETKQKFMEMFAKGIKKRTGRKLMVRSMIPDQKNSRDNVDRLDIPEEILWDKEMCKNDEKTAVALLWEDWRLANVEREAELAEQCKKKKESAAKSRANALKRNSNTEQPNKVAAGALQIGSADTMQPLTRLAKPKLRKMNFTHGSSHKETPILPQTCSARQRLAKAGSKKEEKPERDLATLLRMRKLI